MSLLTNTALHGVPISTDSLLSPSSTPHRPYPIPHTLPFNQAKMNFVSVRSSDLLSKYFGQTEASIRMLFTQVRAAAPCVLFFDEFDVLAYKR